MCQAHKVFRNVIRLPLTFLNYKHLRYPLMKSNSFDHFIKTRRFQLYFALFCPSLDSEVCTLTSILWIDKIPWTVTHASPWFHFHQMEILLLSIVSYLM